MLTFNDSRTQPHTCIADLIISLLLWIKPWIDKLERIRYFFVMTFNSIIIVLSHLMIVSYNLQALLSEDLHV